MTSSDSSLDDFHLHENSEDCWCGPDVEQIKSMDGEIRQLIVHRKIDINLTDMDNEEWKDLWAKLEVEIIIIDQMLREWKESLRGAVA